MANTPSTFKNKVEEAGSSFADKAKDAGAVFAERARETASTVADKSKEAASAVSQKASELASQAGHKAEDAAATVGGGMKTLASTIREKAPQGGMMESASTAVADSLESGGRYLQEQGFTGIANDLTNVIRRNPLPALCLGIGIGFLIARATTSRS